MAGDTCYCERQKQQCYDPATKNGNPLLTGLCDTLKAYGDPCSSKFMKGIDSTNDGKVVLYKYPVNDDGGAAAAGGDNVRNACAICRTACNHIPRCEAVEIDAHEAFPMILMFDTWCSCSFAYAWCDYINDRTFKIALRCPCICMMCSTQPYNEKVGDRATYMGQHPELEDCCGLGD